MKRSLIIIVSVLLFLFLLIIVPVLINESYKGANGYVTFWEAKDVLEYYGSALGAIGTVVAIFISVTISRRAAQAEIEKEKLKNEFDGLNSKVLRIKEAILFEKDLNGSSSLVEILFSMENKKAYDRFIKVLVEDFLSLSDCIDSSDPKQKEYLEKTRDIVVKEAEIHQEYSPKIDAAREAYALYESKKKEWINGRKGKVPFQSQIGEYPETAPLTAREVQNQMFDEMKRIAESEKVSYLKLVNDFIKHMDNIYRKKVKQLFFVK